MRYWDGRAKGQEEGRLGVGIDKMEELDNKLDCLMEEMEAKLDWMQGRIRGVTEAKGASEEDGDILGRQNDRLKRECSDKGGSEVK